MNSPAQNLPRRRWLKAVSGTALGAGLVSASRASAADSADIYKVKNGRIQQSVVPWCFKPMPIAELAGHAARLGLKSVELTTPENFAMLKQHGLICAITGSHGFAKGFAHTEEHEECLKTLRKRIDATAAAGFPSVITFSGFRRGISDEQGMKNMVDGLKKITGYAEQKKVTVCLEMLNSKVAVEMKGHPDYFCDDIERSVEICRRVGSPRVKVLFDIYHVQIMHGDVISRLKQHKDWIGHIHTAGVPGRNEIDDTQELNYPAIMRAIVDLGYRGYVGQEFIPVRDKVASLSQSVRLCDV
ncbi:MAG: TIM barrel protein [Verrucomicrobia bacterium]|nr:TIM barrel protein [Verrucomicrobiota bacterium]